ncbi:unnamed protein product [Acanthoscelides obtectus]|uniref:Major facilitator superfamily (MFS) profile domain-containing protein n=1 Tax=Acanthoscelides obtectus TaxID=200917 RepID=A0A9P0KH08_ACAOB|nr:unnamed protein product [Acanthoscelides obtectus]CAK1667521.1 Monocarboxylate transporter 5 [Acanthoscelides obtectus]
MSPPNSHSADCSYLHSPESDDCKSPSPPDKEDAKLMQDSEKTDSTNDTPSDVPSTAEIVVPPDGGWGWVVVLASFMINLVVDGIIFSFSAFLGEIAAEFGAGKAEVTLVGSLMSGFYLITGPFASAVANKYGFRSVAMFGGVLGAAAFAISHFADSVTFLCVTYGVIGGIGFGFLYVPSIITIGFYFERWRALATGIAVCGSGIGTFVFSPLSEILINIFGWRGALLCQGALVLSCVIYGSLFRPLKPTKLKKLKEDDEESELELDVSTLPDNLKEKMENVSQFLQRNSIYSDYRTSLPKVLIDNEDVYHTISIPNRKSSVSIQGKTLSAPFLADYEKPKKYLLDVDNLKPLVLPRKNSLKEEPEVVRPLYRDDIFFGASLTRLPQYTSKTSIAYNLSVTRLPTKNDIDEEKQHQCKLCPEALKRVLCTMLDFGLLKSPSFIILATGGFFTMMGFYVPYMYLVERAKSGGMDKAMAVWLVSSIGIANTVGRVVCGVISSIPGVNALFVTNVALTIGGIATMFSGLSMSEEYQFFYTVVFGLTISCFASLRSIVVVDLMGLEKLTNAFGLLLLFQGMAAIIGAPLAGAFMMATGSYDACFYLSGGVLLLSAILCYPLNWVNKWENKRNSRREEKKHEAETA